MVKIGKIRDYLNIGLTPNSNRGGKGRSLRALEEELKGELRKVHFINYQSLSAKVALHLLYNIIKNLELIWTIQTYWCP